MSPHLNGLALAPMYADPQGVSARLCLPSTRPWTSALCRRPRPHAHMLPVAPKCAVAWQPSHQHPYPPSHTYVVRMYVVQGMGSETRALRHWPRCLKSTVGSKRSTLEVCVGGHPPLSAESYPSGPDANTKACVARMTLVKPTPSRPTKALAPNYPLHTTTKI